MQDPHPKPLPPRQLLIALDSTRLRGMSSLDRHQVVTRLALLLTEAARTADGERDDDGQ